MRASAGLCTVALTALMGFLASPTSSLLVLPNLPRSDILVAQFRDRLSYSPSKLNTQQQQQQQPLQSWMASQIKAAIGLGSGGDSSNQHSNVLITDVVGRDRSANIFAGLVRDVDTVHARASDKQQNSTILAPVNSAMNALPRKPWEDEAEYESLGASAYQGQDGEDRAHRNLRFFVERHVVLQSPWEEGTTAKTMAGSELRWETRNGKKVVSSRLGFVRLARCLTPGGF